jgi:hypothetical protein
MHILAMGECLTQAVSSFHMNDCSYIIIALALDAILFKKYFS